MRLALRVSLSILLTCVCASVASADVFVLDVAVENNDPDFILSDTDGEVWYMESTAGNFEISHSTGSVEVFVLENDSPEGTFYMDSSGKIGFGTSAPVADLEILDPNASGSTALALSLLTGDTWTLAACTDSCATGLQGFRVVEGGDINSPAPLRIRRGAPTDSILIDSTGVSINAALVQLSSRERKSDFEPVDAAEVLEKVLALPISRWSYRSDPTGSRHVGPTSEDFYAAFELGVDSRGISTVDSGGVALLAIQGLKAAEDARIAALAEAHAAEINALRTRLAALERRLTELIDAGDARTPAPPAHTAR